MEMWRLDVHRGQYIDIESSMSHSVKFKLASRVELKKPATDTMEALEAEIRSTQHVTVISKAALRTLMLFIRASMNLLLYAAFGTEHRGEQKESISFAQAWRM